METEVKLSFRDKDSFRKYCTDLDQAPMLLENNYLDTKDRTVLSRSGSARVRHVSGGGKDFYEFTVKYGGGSSSGLHRRFEWNVRSDDDHFSINAFKEKASMEAGDPVEYLDEVFKGLNDDDLIVLCFNSFNRTVYQLKYKNSTVEACVDSGISQISDKTDEICELELELITGDEKDLMELKELIMNENECVPLDKSKFMRTLALAMGNR